MLSASQARALRITLFLLGAGFFVFKLVPSCFGSGSSHWTEFSSILNETLGTEKIFAINLPERVDKRDNIVLASAVSGIRVEWIDGLAPENLSPTIYPFNWNDEHSSREFASRRAHLNAIQRVVDERLNSAIIMEDDVDWDVSLKKQLQNFATAARALQGVQNPQSDSPYGDDWDILWLGHCRMECKTDKPFYLTPNDPTLPNAYHALRGQENPPGFDVPRDGRVICHAAHCVCSAFYAISFEGAKKVLAALSVNPMELGSQLPTGEQYDIVLGIMCRHGHLRCYAPFPSLTGYFSPAGPLGKTSDIHPNEDLSDGPRTVTSRGLMYSTLVNIHRILRGERTVRATWEDVDVPEINKDDIRFEPGTVIYPRRV